MADGVQNRSVLQQLMSATKHKRITNVVRIELQCFGVLGLILGANGSLREVRSKGALGRTRSMWWGRWVNVVNKCDIPWHFHQFGNKTCVRKTEATTADAKVKPIWCQEEHVGAEKSIREYFEILRNLIYIAISFIYACWTKCVNEP